MLANFTSLRIISIFLFLFFLSSHISFAQSGTVTGSVLGQSGEGLPGVAVQVKGTNIGTTTDNSGNFKLDVADPNAILIFSSIDYERKEISLGGRKTLSVSLTTSSRQLDAVVVVGYGTQRKRDLTGAVTSVKGSDISNQPVLTATQGLQGKVAGVQIISSGSPNSAPIVRIRGTGSILGGANPFYVVDGILTDDIRNINSADIANVDVLKDASAAAIYGVRAANGVILITTKKGRSGKMAVSYNANVGVREASHLVKMANATQYASYINQASINTGNGAVLVDPVLTKTSTDFYGTILRRAFEQNHNVSLSGGSEKINYFFSAGYITDEGIVLNSKFNRFTLRSNNEYKLSDKLRLSSLVSFSRGNTSDVNLGAAYNDAYHAAPVIPAKINGKYGNTSAYQNVGNPLLDIESNNNKFIENRLQATGALDYKPISWLTLHSSYAVEMGFNNRRVYVNQFLNDTSTFIIPGGNQHNDKSSFSVSDDHNIHWVFDNTATFQKSFNKSDLTVLVGTTAERASGEGIFGSRSGVPSDPNLQYLNQGDPASQNNTSSADIRTRNSYLSRVNYGYDKRYLITATFRADGTSLFTKKWGYFPSVGIGWNITNEGFMKNQKSFDFLKLRASYGRLGNDNIPSNAHIQTLQTGLPYFFNNTYTSGVALADIIDKNIHWETTDEANIGLDFTILKGRLSGDFDVYDKKVKDALIRVGISGVLGSPSGTIITNVASIENKGIELGLNWNGKMGRKNSYTISANASYNVNTVVGLNGGQPIYDGYVGSKGSTTLTTNGYAIGSFFILQSNGVFHNQKELAAYKTKSGNSILINGQPPTLGDINYTDVNGDGKIDDKDRVFAGSYQPKVTLGLTSTFNISNLDISLNLYGTIGSKIYNGKKAARFNSLDNVEASVATKSYTLTNYATSVARANLNALPQSTYFLESGDFLRVNNLTLGYTFPKSSISRIGISSFRVFVMSQNLYTLTKYSGFTPELASDNPLSQGIELNAYPTSRTIALGVNLNF